MAGTFRENAGAGWLILMRLMTALLIIGFLGGCSFTENDVNAPDFMGDVEALILPDDMQAEVDRLNQATIEKDMMAVFQKGHPELKALLDQEKIDQIQKYIIGNNLMESRLVDFSYEYEWSLGEGSRTVYSIAYFLKTDKAEIEMTYGLVKSKDCCQLINYNVSLVDFDGEIVLDED